MSLSVTSITRVHGAQCKHFVISVDHDGKPRQFPATESELDELIELLGGPIEAQKSLVLLWLVYRRAAARALTSVVIA